MQTATTKLSVQAGTALSLSRRCDQVALSAGCCPEQEPRAMVEGLIHTLPDPSVALLGTAHRLPPQILPP